MSVLPSADAAFEWHEEPWGPGLTCRPLGAVARHLFTTRRLELTRADGWPAVASTLGVEPHCVLHLKQVHGAAVVLAKIGQPFVPSGAEGDALISDDPSVAVAVRTADCAPILLADRATGAVGAVHAGWKGTAVRVATEAVTAMRKAFGTRPENLLVAIGPTISSCCYEVGPDLVDAFAQQGHERYLIDRWFLARPTGRGETKQPPLRLDIAGSNRDQLVLAGVPDDQIYVAGLCTAMHLEVLTSFRAEGKAAGRLAGVIRPATARGRR